MNNADIRTQFAMNYPDLPVPTDAQIDALSIKAYHRILDGNEVIGLVAIMSDAEEPDFESGWNAYAYVPGRTPPAKWLGWYESRGEAVNAVVEDSHNAYT
jgi:hypothetical protein